MSTASARHWDEVAFNEIIEDSAFGPRFSGDSYADDGNIATLRTTDIFEDGRISYETMPLAQLEEARFANHLLEIGDLVISRSGRVGTTARFSGYHLPVLPGAFLIRFRLRDGADSRFFRYWFNSRTGQQRLLSVARGAAQQNINITNVKTLKVPLPPISVQQRIASILSAYDDLIENNRRRTQLLEQSARLLYKEWFVHLRFPGHERVKIKDGVPEGWEKETIADFFDTTSGGTPSRKTPDFFTGDINWVKTQELNEDFIFETEEKITEEALKKSAAKLFPKNTLLVSIYGGTNIGRTGILAQPAASNQACVALVPKHPSANHVYAQLFFQHVREHLIGIAQGSAQTNISQDTLRKVSMLMPSESLMLHFLQSVSASYEQLKNLTRQNASLAKARDLLLPRLMNGELSV